MRKQELTQTLLFSPYFHVQAPEPPVEKAAIPPEFTAMVATFDGLKDQIKAVASSPVSPTHETTHGRAADPFLAMDQFCTCVYVLYVSDHRELDYTFGEPIHYIKHIFPVLVLHELFCDYYCNAGYIHIAAKITADHREPPSPSVCVHYMLILCSCSCAAFQDIHSCSVIVY